MIQLTGCPVGLSRGKEIMTEQSEYWYLAIALEGLFVPGKPRCSCCTRPGIVGVPMLDERNAFMELWLYWVDKLNKEERYERYLLRRKYDGTEAAEDIERILRSENFYRDGIERGEYYEFERLLSQGKREREIMRRKVVTQQQHRNTRRNAVMREYWKSHRAPGQRLKHMSRQGKKRMLRFFWVHRLSEDMPYGSLQAGPRIALQRELESRRYIPGNS